MLTYSRICIKDHDVHAQNGDHQPIRRGKEYTTSEETNGEVMVFSSFWVKVPAGIFAGEIANFSLGENEPPATEALKQ